MSSDQEALKKAVARAALAYVPEEGVVGLGTGSTAKHFIDGVGELVGSISDAAFANGATHVTVHVARDTPTSPPAFVIPPGASECASRAPSRRPLRRPFGRRSIR